MIEVIWWEWGTGTGSHWRSIFHTKNSKIKTTEYAEGTEKKFSVLSELSGLLFGVRGVPCLLFPVSLLSPIQWQNII
jgi:hypothetical protein